ncbi:MAG: hypothetical protein GY898_11475 [Proteobacteria bacterium]|nr:hypothetical protein [Pseudomonadota bacterium]
MTSASTLRGLLVGASLVLAATFARPVQAQEALPAVLPEVLFLIEDSARIGQNWDGTDSVGSPHVTNPDARFTYIVSAIKQVINNAPVGMTFGVALTADGNNDSTQANESDLGFEPLAYPGTPSATIGTLLDGYTTSNTGARTFAESYAEVLDGWAEESYVSPRSWAGGPFQYYCNSLVVIVIGSNIGEEDDNPDTTYTTSDPLTLGFQCNDSGGAQACWGDNVAHHAYNGFAAPLAGSGSVSTYTLLIDSDSASISTEAAPYYQTMANQGQGLYYSAPKPGGIQTAIWGMLTDSFSGSYSNASIAAMPDGSMLFASWFEVDSGHPLYKGHLMAWNVQTDPEATDFGQIIETSETYGEAWDAGQLLASREAESGEDNQGNFDPLEQRNGYIAYEAMEMYSAMQPFDYSGLLTGDLLELLVDEVAVTANPSCLPLDTDYDFDCDVDIDDGKILVDFIRGVNESTFLHTGLPRGYWKMGDTGHSIAVPAPATLNAIATETHFQAFIEKVGTLPSMVYVASNSGMIHAFNTDVVGHEGSEYWFVVPRSKAHKDPTNSAVREYDGYQLDDLMRSGQTYVNQGRLTLDTVWLDGYMNGLGSSDNFPGCTGPGYTPAEDDGVIEPNGCEWHRVLVWAGGYGARHVYGIDVTNPYTPRFLWERTDTNGNTGPGKGRAVGAAAVGPFVDRSSGAERRWIVFWGAGEQSPEVSTTSAASQKVHASVFIHDMDSTTSRIPTTYSSDGYRATGTANHLSSVVSDSDADGFEEYGTLTPGVLAKGLFGSPSMVDFDGDASVDAAYIGDSLGYIFKVLFNEITPGSPSRCTFASPDASDDVKHLWYKPAVFFSLAGEVLVYYASGSPHNVYSTQNGGLYVKSDPTPLGCTAANAAPCADTSTLFNSQGFYEFTGTGEKLVGDPIAAFGRLFFTTHIPGSDPCVLGTSRLYGLNVETCGGGIPDVTSDSYDQDSTGLYTVVDGLISAPVFANGRVYALNLDAGGLDSDSMIDDLQVVPDDFSGGFFMFNGFRSVF